MCGIVGYWSRTHFSNNVIKIMCDQIRHRGPDAECTWSDKSQGLFLGHRRLSILDLSDAGKQPMTSSCGRYIFVFNGKSNICLKNGNISIGSFILSDDFTGVFHSKVHNIF